MSSLKHGDKGFCNTNEEILQRYLFKVKQILWHSKFLKYLLLEIVKRHDLDNIININKTFSYVQNNILIIIKGIKYSYHNLAFLF